MEIELAWIKDNSVLYESNNFIYEINLFLLKKNHFSLANNKIVASDIFIPGIVHSINYEFNNFKLIKETELISAPIKWIQQNGYLYEQLLNKNQRKKLEKEKKNEIK